MIEPIQGEGRFIVPAVGFLPALRRWAEENDVVFIADEVQTGFCRTGDWFACDHEEVVSDLIVLAKGMANGLPLSAVTGTANIMDSVHVGGLGGTYGGNPVACAASLAAMDRMAEKNLADRARNISRIIATQLAPLVEDLNHAAEVRGRGAMMALEFHEPGSGPLPDVAKQVAASCAQSGVIVLTAGTHGNVIRLLSPLTIADETLTEGLGVLVDSVRGVERP